MRIKVRAIQALEPEYGLPVLLKVAGMARSTFYYQCSAMNRPEDKHKDIIKRMKELHERHKGRYGYRRLTAALRSEHYIINHKTVRKLMRENGLMCKIRRKRKMCRPSAELDIAPNLLNREFNADAPFQKGVTDVTEFNVGKHKVYVSAIQDLYDGAVISMSYSLENNTELIMSMYKPDISDGTSAAGQHADTLRSGSTVSVNSLQRLYSHQKYNPKYVSQRQLL